MSRAKAGIVQIKIAGAIKHEIPFFAKNQKLEVMRKAMTWLDNSEHSECELWVAEDGAKRWGVFSYQAGAKEAIRIEGSAR
jgi:hypothetical protein